MKKITTLLIFFLFILPIFSAMTIINIKTLPGQDLQITPIRIGGGFDAYESTKTYISDGYGDLELQYDIDYAFDLNVVIKQGTETIYRKKITEEFQPGEIYQITVAPEDAELIETPTKKTEEITKTEKIIEKNITIIEGSATNEALINKTEDNSTNFEFIMNGYTVLKDFSKKKTTLYSIPILILFISGIFTFLLIKKRKLRTQKQEKKTELPQNDNDELEEAKKEMQEAQRKFNKIKQTRDEKIKEAKKKLIEDEKELMRLRGEKKN